MDRRRSLALLLCAATALACGGDDESVSAAGPTGGGGSGGDLFDDDPCPPPNRMVGDICREPGVDDDGCAAGSIVQSDGSCAAAGIPSAGCGRGFVHDGDVGCVPTLPADPCEETAGGEPTMAVPGDTACRPIADCGTGKWGNIPIGASTVFVDESYPDADGDGTMGKPFPSLEAAIAAASPGDLLAVAAGSYFVGVWIGKPLTIQGVCADQVLLIQDPFVSTTGAIDLSAGASGTTVRDVAIASSLVGVNVDGATDVIVDRVHLRDNGGGLQAIGGAEVTLSGSLVEGNAQRNVFVYGSSLTVDRSVLRRATPQGSPSVGVGIWTQTDDNLVPSSSTVRGSVIEENVFFGAYTSGSTLLLEDSVVRDTKPNAAGLAGRGVTSNRSPDGSLRASVTVRRSYLEGNHEASAFAGGSDLVIEDTVVRDTRLPVTGVEPGSIAIMAQPTTLSSVEPSATLTVRRSVVEGALGAGVFSSGGELVVESTVIRDIDPDANGIGGRGLYCRADHDSGDPCHGTIAGSVIERTHEVGLYIAGSSAEIRSTLVRDTLPDASGRGRGGSFTRSFDDALASNVICDACVFEDAIDHGLFVRGSTAEVRNTAIRRVAPNAGIGRCLGVQGASEASAAGSLELSSSSCSDAHEVGIFAGGSTIDLARVSVTKIRPSPAGGGRALEIQSSQGLLGEGHVIDSRFGDAVEFGVAIFGARLGLERCVVEAAAANSAGLFGDGIAAFAQGGPPALTLVGSLVRDNARAGLSGFAGTLDVGGTTFRCNALDLVDGAGGVSFTNGGGNACGCPATPDSCQLAGDTIEAPTPLGEASGDDDTKQ